MKTITPRELRNAEVLQGVEAGETYIVIKNGKPVARLTPVTPDGISESLPLARPATTPIDYTTIKRVKADIHSEELLGDLRGDR